MYAIRINILTCKFRLVLIFNHIDYYLHVYRRLVTYGENINLSYHQSAFQIAFTCRSAPPPHIAKPSSVFRFFSILSELFPLRLTAYTVTRVVPPV